jgi:hypothetical protein
LIVWCALCLLHRLTCLLLFDPCPHYQQALRAPRLIVSFMLSTSPLLHVVKWFLLCYLSHIAFRCASRWATLSLVTKCPL